jgi:hypothetical protein
MEEVSGGELSRRDEYDIRAVHEFDDREQGSLQKVLRQDEKDFRIRRRVSTFFVSIRGSV